MAKPFVVSLRSRGVYTFNPQRACDLRQHARQLGLEFLDIGISIFINFTVQTWTSWFSVFLVLFSLLFWHSIDNKESYFDQSFIWVPFSFLIYLPLLWVIHQNFERREKALCQLSKVKSYVMAVWSAYEIALPHGTSSDVEPMRLLLSKLLDDMHKYFQHPRAYAEHFTFPVALGSQSPTHPLYISSRSMGVMLRRMHVDVRDVQRQSQVLSSLGASEGAAAAVLGYAVKLHGAIEQLTNYKEMRTPLILRAFLRNYVTIISPIFLGPYYPRALPGLGLMYQIILAIMVQLCAMTLMTLALHLEDPFNDTSPDSISGCVFEAKDHLGFMMADEDQEGARGPSTIPSVVIGDDQGSAVREAAGLGTTAAKHDGTAGPMPPMPAVHAYA